MARIPVSNRPAKFSESTFTDFLKTYQPGESPHPHEAQWERQRTVRAVMDVYDNTFTLIEWPNDCLGCVVSNAVSFVLSLPGPRLFICGERGMLAVGVPGSGSRLSLSTLDQATPYYVPGSGTTPPGRPEDVGRYHFSSDAFPAWRYTAGSVQHLHDCIVNDTEPLASMKWGCHVAEIMIKTFEPAEKGQALDLITTF